jgi:hypothetical protein
MLLGQAVERVRCSRSLDKDIFPTLPSPLLLSVSTVLEVGWRPARTVLFLAMRQAERYGWLGQGCPALSRFLPVPLAPLFVVYHTWPELSSHLLALRPGAPLLLSRQMADDKNPCCIRRVLYTGQNISSTKDRIGFLIG